MVLSYSISTTCVCIYLFPILIQELVIFLLLILLHFSEDLVQGRDVESIRIERECNDALLCIQGKSISVPYGNEVIGLQSIKLGQATLGVSGMELGYDAMVKILSNHGCRIQVSW